MIRNPGTVGDKLAHIV